MTEWYGLRNMYEVVLTDVNNLTETTRFANGWPNDFLGKKLSDILNKTLPLDYKERQCFFNETDFEHHNEYFLSEIRGVSFSIGPDGLRVHVRFGKKGRFVDANSSTYYQLVGHRITRNSFDKLLDKKLEKLGKKTYENYPRIELLPYKDEPTEDIFLIFSNNYGFL